MKKNIFREIFSGANGKLSAKRVIGGFAMIVALGCTIYLVISDGSNNVVENLLMTIFITSVSLLGLPAVTGVWGSSKINIEKQEEIEENPIQNQSAGVDVMDCSKCIYKKYYDENKKDK